MWGEGAAQPRVSPYPLSAIHQAHKVFEEFQILGTFGYVPYRFLECVA